MDCEKKESPLSPRNLWWKVALAFVVGLMLAVYAMSAALNFIWCPAKTPADDMVVIEEPLEILPPPPGYVQEEILEPIEIMPPPGYGQKESR